MVPEEEVATRVLLTGAGGLLGHAIAETWADLDACARSDLDVTDIPAVRAILDQTRPEVIVQGAAFTRVDDAETERDAAERTNHDATASMARECGARKILLVFLSTDYVFDGVLKRPYVEEDPVAPLSHYAATKWRGEEAVRASGAEHLIVRVQALYGEGRQTLVDKLLAQNDPDGTFKMAKDRVSQPSYAVDVAEALSRLLESGARGTFHVANQGPLSWYDFARMVREESGRPRGTIVPVPGASLNETAARPSYSALSSARYEKTAGSPMRTVREALRAYLRRMTGA